MTDLQLCDYVDGYRFRLKCKACGYGWHEEPSVILMLPEVHSRMYLEELEADMGCRRCHKQAVEITPLVKAKPHHFIGGMV